MRSIFDTHTHYDDEAFDEDRETLLRTPIDYSSSFYTNKFLIVSKNKTTIHIRFITIKE